MAGLTSTGAEGKTTDDILGELQRDQRNAISASLVVPGSAEELNQSSQGVIGQINGIMADKLADLWAFGVALWSAFRILAAGGTDLTNLCLIRGSEREAATKGIIPGCVVNVNPGTYPAGTLIAQVTGDATRLASNKTDVVNGGGSAANITVDYQAQTAGAISFPSGTLVISQSVSGWNSITNPVDGVPGLDDDTDTTLFTRSEGELSAGGSSSPDAIRSNILENLKSNITNCRVLANDGDTVDANGLPAHSLEVIARGNDEGTDATTALVTQIAKFKDAGDRSYSGNNTYQNVTDDEGNVLKIGYSWATDKDLYVDVTVEIDSKLFPADGDTQIKNAIVALNSGYDPGSKAVFEKIRGAAFVVKGVTDVPTFRLDTVFPPVGTTNITSGIRETPVLDTGRIRVFHM